MSPVVASAIKCLAAAPGFEQLRDEVEALGFSKQAGGERTPLDRADGHVVLLSYSASQAICSVWFEGEYETEALELASLLTRDGYSAKSHADQFGTAWTIGNGRLMRLVTKEEDAKPGFGAEFRRLAKNLRLVTKRVYKQRLSAALFVQRD
jgi:hypothetical protein